MRGLPGRSNELPNIATFVPVVSRGGTNARAARSLRAKRREALLGFPLPAAQRVDARYEKTYRAAQRSHPPSEGIRTRHCHLRHRVSPTEPGDRCESASLLFHTGEATMWASHRLWPPSRPRRPSWTTSDASSTSWTSSASGSVEGWNLMLDTRPAGTALNLLLPVTLLHALHSANWRRIVWKPTLPAAVRMRGGMSER